MAREALTTLCEAYWEPLYAFIRRQGHSVEAAEDLTQGYFALLLEKHYLNGVDPSKGRLRSFLLASVKHFLANEWDKERALKRGGEVDLIALDRETAETRYRELAVEELTPEKIFERRWARTVLERVLDKLQQEAVSKGKQDHFELLKPYLIGGEQTMPYRPIAEQLGTSESAIRTAVYRLRRRFGHRLRDEIADTVASKSDVDAELRHLLKVMGS